MYGVLSLVHWALSVVLGVLRDMGAETHTWSFEALGRALRVVQWGVRTRSDRSVGGASVDVEACRWVLDA